MASQTRIEIKGLKELDARLRELPVAIGRRVLSGALRSAALRIQKEAIARAPVSSADVHKKGAKLRDSIRTATVAEATASATVVIHTGRAYWARFIEFGTKNRRLKTKTIMSDGKRFYGVEVGAITAKPFMRPAYDSKVREAIERFGVALGVSLDRAVKRLNSGGRAK